MTPAPDTAEHRRLAEARDGTPWRRWGPYLSERQWGTVREDYSRGRRRVGVLHATTRPARAPTAGARTASPASRDDRQPLCFALALWNGADPILKERLFGLTNEEGNHGEDVKEYYFYVDATPTHSYMRYLYKYPQAAFPYEDLVETNAARSREELEYELLDTGIFDEDRYFDVEVEYAKASPEDILVRITAHNRGPERATLHLLPTLWFRNTWSGDGAAADRPSLHGIPGEVPLVLAGHAALGERLLVCGGSPELLVHRQRDQRRAADGRAQPRAVREGRDRRRGSSTDASGTVNPDLVGTKAAAHYVLEIEGGGSAEIRLRLLEPPAGPVPPSAELAALVGPAFTAVFDERRREADAFYASVIPATLSEDEAPGHAPGAGRDAVVQAVLLLRRRPLARRAGLRPVRPHEARRRRATSAGTTSTTPTSSRCPTSGSTRGTRPGTSRSTCSRSRWWTRTSARRSWS